MTPRSMLVGVSLLLIAMLCTGADLACADFTLDRSYEMGDLDNDAGTPMANDPVGSSTSTGDTFDSIGSLGAGDFQDLTPSLGGPIYVDVGSRPMASGSTLGIQFDGVDDYLQGARLGLPSTSASAAADSTDYSGISDRGYQFWVNPSSSGQGNATAQSLVADTNQHGVRISESDTWVMRYAGTDFDSGVSVSFDSWSHVMLARPFGLANGATLWVDGVAVARAGGGYDGGDDTPLVVGANTGDTPGSSEYFSGVIDDLEMFVLGVSAETQFDHGTFSFDTDNEFAASVLGTRTPGDATGDDMVTDADVSVFVANWEEQQLVNGIPTGDIDSLSVADFNFDGTTDILDWYEIALNHEDAASLNLGELLANRGVPEPSTVVILAIGGAWLVSLRRRTLSQVWPVAALVVAWAVCPGVSKAQIVGDDFNDGVINVQWTVDDADTIDIVDETSSPGSLRMDVATGQDAWANNRGGAVFFYGDSPTGDWTIDTRVERVGGIGGSWIGGLALFDNGASDLAEFPFELSWGLEVGNIVSLQIPGSTLLTSDITDGTQSQHLRMDYTSGTDTYTVFHRNTALDAWIEAGSVTGDQLAGGGVTGGNLQAGLFTKTFGGNSTSATLDYAYFNVNNVGETPFDPITVAVDRSNGLITFNTSGTQSLIAYDIQSAGGGLDPSNWTSIAENYDADSGATVDDSGNWSEFTDPADSDNLAEGRIGTALDFVDQSISLGNAWIRSPFEDLSVEILLPDGTAQSVPVAYTGDPISVADLDANGIVEVADWNQFKPQFTTDTTGLTAVAQWQAGDLNNDGIVNLRDATVFADAYDAANGAGAFAASVGPIPEPTAASLLGLSLLSMAAYYSCRQRRKLKENRNLFDN